MSRELDAFFTAMSHDADGLPAATPDTVRRLGRRRRRRATVIAAVTVFFLVGTVAVAIGAGLPKGPPRPAVTPSAVAPSGTSTAAVAPTTFQKLAPVGATISLANSQSPPRFGTVVTAGDRAFVCWQSESGQTNVVAVDLSTGRVAWGPVHVADFDDTAAVYWHPRYVVVMGRNDNGSRPDGAVFALDPGTGKVLLDVDVDNFEADDLVLGGSTLVIASRPDGKTRGYDLATGRVSWTVPDPASRIVQSLAVQTAAGSPPESQRGGLGGPPVATDRFVQFTADGTAILRDLATGAETARRPGAVGAVDPEDNGQTQDEALAVDGVLYSIDRNRRNVVRAADLSGQGAASNLYTAESGVQLGRLLWCGPAQICVGEHREPDIDGIAGLDTGTHKVRWRQDGFVTRMQVVDGQVLLNLTTRAVDNRSVVIDPAGRPLLSEQAQAGAAGWIDGNALLVLQPRPDSRSTEVSGVSPLSGGPVPLGTVEDARGCGWSRTHLVCVTTTGITVWRFAA